MNDIEYAQREYSASRNKKTFARIVLAGNQGVGKTSILKRLAYDIFDGDKSGTVGADLVTKSFVIGDTCEHADTCTSVYTHIWDTAGQERFMSMCGIYFRQADMIMLCYDTTNTTTLLELESKWWPIVTIFVNVPDVVLFIVGTKCDSAGNDSPKQNMYVEQDEIVRTRWLAPEGQGIWSECVTSGNVSAMDAHRPKFVKHFRCSAKNPHAEHGISDIFQEAANMFKNYSFKTTIGNNTNNDEYIGFNQPNRACSVIPKNINYGHCCSIQ